MGTENVRALIATGGNVEGAVEYILGGESERPQSALC